MVSELLTDFLDSLAEPPIPRSLRDTALSAAALSDTETLLSLPTKLPKAHAGVFSELVALASTVLQALEDKDASAPSSEPGTPGAQGPESPRSVRPGCVGLAAYLIGLSLLTSCLHHAYIMLTSSSDCPCLRQDRLRLAQLHLLERLALLLLRPTDQELSNAQRFVAFFLFGTRFPDEPPRANCAG